VAAVLAVTTALSCGTGIRDGEGEVYVSKTVDYPGDTLVLGEATLELGIGCVEAPALVTLRRFPTIGHSGAVSPVFEIQVPTTDTVKRDPKISIATSPAVADNSASVIGFLVPGAKDEQWVPDSPTMKLPCLPGVVCGPVQSGGFQNPGSGISPTTKMDFAIVQQCGGIEDCGLYQGCSSNACQACATNSPCNYPKP
jgi:hypothetical protein